MSMRVELPARIFLDGPSIWMEHGGQMVDLSKLDSIAELRTLLYGLAMAQMQAAAEPKETKQPAQPASPQAGLGAEFQQHNDAIRNSAAKLRSELQQHSDSIVGQYNDIVASVRKSEKRQE